MKNRVFIIASITLFFLLTTTLLCSCTSTKSEQIKNPTELYQEALEKLPAAYSLDIIKETTITVGKKSYTESSNIYLVCNQIEPDNTKIQLTETIKSGVATNTVMEICVNNMLYLSIQDCTFSSAISNEVIATRYIPAAALTEGLYSECTSATAMDITKVHFAAPADAEFWAIPSGCQFIDATGNAYINAGKLESIDYSLSYYYGNALVEKNFTIQINTDSNTEILPPNDLEAYTPIDYIDGPVLLEKMCGLLLQESSISAKSEEYMYCGPFGDQRTKTETVNIHLLSPLDANIDTTITQANTSHCDTASIVTKQYQAFTNGTYSITTDHNPAVEDPSIQESYMREYCQNILLGAILMPDYIKNATLTSRDNYLVINYQATEVFGQIVTEEICNTLYGNPTALSALASNHTVNEVSCTIEIDQYTGLPHKASIIYEGNYIIDEVSYPLEYQLTQIYQ